MAPKKLSPGALGRNVFPDFNCGRRLAWTHGEADPRRQEPSLSLNYPVPDACSSEEEFVQFYHRDLAAMTSSQLRTEAARLRLFLLVTRGADPWHLGRLAAIRKGLRHAT